MGLKKTLCLKDKPGFSKKFHSTVLLVIGCPEDHHETPL